MMLHHARRMHFNALSSLYQWWAMMRSISTIELLQSSLLSLLFFLENQNKYAPERIKNGRCGHKNATMDRAIDGADKRKHFASQKSANNKITLVVKATPLECSFERAAIWKAISTNPLSGLRNLCGVIKNFECLRMFEHFLQQ